MQFIDVNGIGPKVFEMAAGFLRIHDGDRPLDATPVHPEMYPIVERWAEELQVGVADLCANPSLLDGLDLASYASGSIGVRALEDVRRWLAGGVDPRPAFRVPSHKEIQGIEDLAIGMDVEGVVTNVTDFGAFVDVGAYHDGLVHLSELANHFVRDPREVVSVGEVLKVRVIGVDLEHKRISLSRKALQPAPNRNPRRRERKPGDGQQPAPGQPQSSPPPQPQRVDARPAPGHAAGPADHGQRPKPQARRNKDRKRDPRGGGHAPSHAPEKTDEVLNTLLADQLLALREKFKS
jgi:uncharacterized protein